MADPRKAFAVNIPADPNGHPFGGFFVDPTCINRREAADKTARCTGMGSDTMHQTMSC